MRTSSRLGNGNLGGFFLCFPEANVARSGRFRRIQEYSRRSRMERADSSRNLNTVGRQPRYSTVDGMVRTGIRVIPCVGGLTFKCRRANAGPGWVLSESHSTRAYLRSGGGRCSSWQLNEWPFIHACPRRIRRRRVSPSTRRANVSMRSAGLKDGPSQRSTWTTATPGGT